MTAQATLDRAQSVGLYLHLDDGQLRLSGDKSALAGLLPELRQYRAELVQLLSKRTIDQMPVASELAPLLAAAMAYCNHTGASDKARADWHADIAATPPEQRGELAAYLQSQLPAPSLKAQAPTVAPAPATKPMPKFHHAQAWREPDRAFQAHYWQCPACKAAARSGGLCPVGQPLQDAVDRAT
jgi:hypothetical protein